MRIFHPPVSASRTKSFTLWPLYWPMLHSEIVAMLSSNAYIWTNLPTNGEELQPPVKSVEKSFSMALRPTSKAAPKPGGSRRERHPAYIVLRRQRRRACCMPQQSAFLRIQSPDEF